MTRATITNLRVLHVIPSLGPLRGGPSLALATMARGLARANVAVDVVTTDDNGPYRLAVPLGQPVAQDGYRILYFPRQTHFYSFSWPLTRWLAQYVGKYDIVHIHALFSYAGLPASIFARRSGVPYLVRPLGVLNRWGMVHRRPILKRLSFLLIEQHILSAAALIHYTTEQERAEAATLGVAGPSEIIPIGVELTASGAVELPQNWYCSRFPALNGRTVILFLSRLDPKKGLDLLLAAFAQVKCQIPTAALVLAGEGDPNFISELQRKTESLRLTPDVFWAGFVAKEAKAAALAGADIFVLPSYSENYGIAVMEAMAYGLPVIISDQVGLSGEVSDNEAGLVVSCAVEPLAQAIVRLACDPSLRRRLGQNGRRLANERFSLETTTDQLIQTYNRLTRKSITL